MDIDCENVVIIVRAMIALHLIVDGLLNSAIGSQFYHLRVE